MHLRHERTCVAALCRAVSPSASCMCTAAPAPHKRRTISTWPRAAARCRLVHLPALVVPSIGAPALQLGSLPGRKLDAHHKFHGWQPMDWLEAHVKMPVPLC